MKKENLKINFIYQSAYQILAMILPIVTSPYIARVLGADGIGVYSYTYSIVANFVLVAKFGLSNYGNRCIAAVRDDQKKMNQVFSDLVFLHAVITVLVTLVYIGFVIKFGEEYKTILFIQGAYLIAQILDINWFYFGIEKFKITVVRNTIIKVLTVVAIFLLVKKEDDIWLYVLIMALGSVISESAVWVFTRKYVKLIKPNIHNFKEHIGSMVVFFIPSVAVNIYKVMDKVMLGNMSGTYQLGLYENAEKIIVMCLAFVTALGTVMLPRATNLVATGKMQESLSLMKKSSQFILMLSYAMCFGIIGVSDVFPTIFWGMEFRECNCLLIGLAISLPFTAIANVVRTQFLIPMCREKIYVVAVCVGAGVNLLINSLCIPYFNAKGAVFGTIIAEVAVCIIQLNAVKKELPIWNYVKKTIPFLIFGIIEGVCVYWIGNKIGLSIVSLSLQILVGVIIYMVLSLGYLVNKRKALK